MEPKLNPVSELRFTGMTANSNVRLPVGEVRYAQNFVLRDGRWEPRGGLDQLGAQLSAGNKVQGMVDFEELDGTKHTLAFCNADLWEYNWGSNSWAQTDLAGQGITMDPSADLSFANSRGRLIVTDGVNTPWMWDGTTYTVLTGAPIAGGVAIYYDKVFFYDLPGEEGTFKWSEEGDPTSGYEISPYQNAWDYAQTDQGGIKGMVGLNANLLVFKEDASAQVMGQVSTNFQTNAVREGLSETVGLIGTHADGVLDGDVWFLSQLGPRVAMRGQAIQDPTRSNEGFDRLKDIWSTVNRAQWHRSICAVDTQLRQIWWAVPTTTAERRTVIVYSAESHSWQVFTFGFDISSMAEVEDASGDEWILLGDDNGNVYRYAEPSSTSDAGTAIEYILRSRLYGNSTPDISKRLVEVRWILDILSEPCYMTSWFTENSDVADGPWEHGLNELGQIPVRRGFNAIGRAGVGWEIVIDTLDHRASVVSVTSALTAVHSKAW